jgi:hypothetical protein
LKRLLILTCWLVATAAIADSPSARGLKRVKSAERIDQLPVIDGRLNDAIWNTIEAEKEHFFQFEPDNGQRSAFQTAVKIHYSDKAIYVAAKLYDPEPQKIRTEKGPRDSFGRNADMFGIAIDAYNSGQNAFYFIVSAAGVQTDKMVMPNGIDYNWDAVWNSAVQITEDGWTVEIEIPYYSLRFPQNSEQEWSINLMRRVERKRELSYWNYVDNSVNGFVTQFGVLTGISNIQPPLRLSFSPYVTTYYDHNGTDGSGRVTGGMDVKYGINEAYTLDMTLIPDFGQVVSDNQVLNLTPFEIRFAENRPFFTEGTDIFDKGGLFYSRRVGQSFGRVQLQPGEELISRPMEAPLLNATKLSGRNQNGTALGLFNAVTNATYASIANPETGEIHEQQIDPITNFNVAVYDQNLKNNSNFSFINTNVTRLGDAHDANVSATQLRLLDKTNTYQVSAFGAVSHLMFANADNQTGYKYNVSFSKVSGNFRYGAGRNVDSEQYNPNDMGFLTNSNVVYNWARVGYNIFKPFSHFNRLSVNSYASYNTLYNPNNFTRLGFYNSLSFQTRNFLNFYTSSSFRPINSYDYFEPRVQGRVFMRPPSYDANFSFSTDHRNNFFVSMGTGFWESKEREQLDYWLRISPRMRFNDVLSIDYSVDMSKQFSSYGFVDRKAGEHGLDVIFGERDIDILTNLVGVNLNISSKMAFNFRMRHYWSKVEYMKLFELMEDGDMGKLPARHEGLAPEQYNTNLNIFNIDAFYTWQIAPGSFINVVWKDAVFTSDKAVETFYLTNLRNTMQANHINNVSLRLIYFIDYMTAKNTFSRI